MFSGENTIEPELIDITSEASEIESDIESHTTFPGRSSQETSEAEDGVPASEEVSDNQTNTESENQDAVSKEREGNDDNLSPSGDAGDVNTGSSSGLQEITMISTSQSEQQRTILTTNEAVEPTRVSSSPAVAGIRPLDVPVIQEPEEMTESNDNSTTVSDSRLLPPRHSDFWERNQSHCDSLQAAEELGNQLSRRLMDMRNRAQDLLSSVNQQTSRDSLNTTDPRSPTTDDMSMIVQVGEDVAEINDLEDESSYSTAGLAQEEESLLLLPSREWYTNTLKEDTTNWDKFRPQMGRGRRPMSLTSFISATQANEHTEFDQEMRPRPSGFAARRDDALVPSYEEVSSPMKAQEIPGTVDDCVEDTSDERQAQMTTQEVEPTINIESGISEVNEQEEDTSTASNEPSSSIDAGTEIVTVESNISSSMEPATEASMSGLSESAAQNADVMEKEISLTAELVPEETAGCSEDREMNFTEFSEEAELSSVTTLDSDKPEVTHAPSLTEENVVDIKEEKATAVSCPEQGIDADEAVDSSAEEAIATTSNPLSAFTQEMVAEPLDADDTTAPLGEPQLEPESKSAQAESVHAASSPFQDEILSPEAVIEPTQEPEKIPPEDKEVSAIEVNVAQEESSLQAAETRLEMEPSFIQEDVDDDFPQTQNMVLELELESDENTEFTFENTSLVEKDGTEDKDLLFSEEMVKVRGSETQEEIDDNISDTDDKVSVAEPVIEMQLLQHESETAFELLHVPEVVSPKSEEVIEEEMHITSDVAIETEVPEREKGASAHTEQQESNAATACMSQDEADSVNQLRNEEELQIAVQSIEEKDSSGLFQIMILFPCCLKQN